MNPGNGKIARLPRTVREELNQRLDDGEPADTLLPWLNDRPEVRRVLAAQFGGRPVSPQNLSEWRQRGFRAWQRQRTACEAATTLTQRSQALAKGDEEVSLSDHLARVLAAELFQRLETLMDGETDPQTRWQQLREIIHEARHLRRGDTAARRLQIEQERWERQREMQDQRWEWEQGKRGRKDMDRMKAGIRQVALAPIHFDAARREFLKIFGDSEAGQRIAWYYAAVQTDMPPEKWWPPGDRVAEEDQTQSDLVQPSPTQSNPIKADN